MAEEVQRRGAGGGVSDFSVLCSALNKCNLQKTLIETVNAFVDSISVMRKNVPKLPSYKQEYLLHDNLVYQTIMHMMRLVTSLC